MAVSVMQVWVMRMLMPHRLVTVPMEVRFAYRPVMTVFMMFVVSVE